MEFNVGDKVRGVPNSIYGITNDDMTLGEVIEVDEQIIHVKVLEHNQETFVDGEFWVNPDYFENVEKPKCEVRTPESPEDAFALIESMSDTLNESNAPHVLRAKLLAVIETARLGRAMLSPTQSAFDPEKTEIG
jgi:hypothetical protein